MTEALSNVAVFDERIATREAKIGIVGLGYAGLPLAMAFAETGFEVTGVDLDAHRVRAIRDGRSYLVDVPAERYAGLDGRLHATTDYGAVSELDALTICVPTPLSKTRSPDLSYIVSAAESVAANLRPGQLVVLQSTTYPGTTEEIVLPILERSAGEAGSDFFLGYAPERVDPGNRSWNIRNTPKLVAGVTPECRRRTELLYRQIVDAIVPCSSPMVAETAKIHENTFRAVNIALANELALMCDRLGISPWEVIEAAHEVNARMPIYVVQKIADALNDAGLPIKGSRILLLGMAYKPDVHDMRESPSLEVMRQLLLRGGSVAYCDPWVDVVDLDGVHHESLPWSAATVRDADCVVVLTAHSVFVEDALWDEAPLIVDTRNAVPLETTAHVTRI